MPSTNLLFYQDDKGNVPVLEWLDELQARDRKAWARCRARIDRLAEAGHELRRPEADYLRDGVYELRAKQGHVQYRILYFFHGRNIAILAHAVTKERVAVDPADIDRAVQRKDKFVRAPQKHTFTE